MNFREAHELRAIVPVSVWTTRLPIRISSEKGTGRGEDWSGWNSSTQ
jgi:hypothetical protein